MKRTMYIVLLAVLASCGAKNMPVEYTDAGRTAKIYPDYKDVVVPPNIAPLNFIVHENADSYALRLSVGNREINVFADKYGKIDIPEKEWHEMLGEAKEKDISVEIYGKTDKGWERYKDFCIAVAAEPIDKYISYRLIEPGYEVYRQLGLYQRNVSDFSVRTIYENNRSFDTGNNHCVNCHNYQNYSAKNMLFHIRGKHGGTMVVRNGKPEKMDMSSDSTLAAAVYPAWHPAKPWVVFSSNKTGQTFHIRDKQKIEVVDWASDLVFYDTERRTISNVLKTNDALETFPCWNSDGTKLYYCVAQVPAFNEIHPSQQERNIAGHYRDLRYNIMSVAFDAKTRTFGKPALEVDCASMGKSASVPRVSPDGRYLLFTLGDYGQFHIWHRSADLYIKNLQTGEVRPLSTANSNDAESYHTWSSNGRWILFASRRDDGSYTRLYISYFDRKGREHKPFLLPQRDPEQNILLMKSYNVPEMTKDAVEVPAERFKSVIYETKGSAVKYEQLGKNKD